MTPLIVGLTVRSLQGERGHKGFKVREALFSSVCQQRQPLSTIHSLFISLFFPGRQRFQGTGRNWRTQGEFGRNKQCSSDCHFWTSCYFMVPFSNFYILFFVPIREKLVTPAFLAAKDLQDWTWVFRVACSDPITQFLDFCDCGNHKYLDREDSNTQTDVCGLEMEWWNSSTCTSAKKGHACRSQPQLPV